MPFRFVTAGRLVVTMVKTSQKRNNCKKERPGGLDVSTSTTPPPSRTSLRNSFFTAGFGTRLGSRFLHGASITCQGVPCTKLAWEGGEPRYRRYAILCILFVYIDPVHAAKERKNSIRTSVQTSCTSFADKAGRQAPLRMSHSAGLRRRRSERDTASRKKTCRPSDASCWSPSFVEDPRAAELLFHPLRQWAPGCDPPKAVVFLSLYARG
jgi:hypothetical protein